MADRHPSSRSYLVGALLARTGDEMAGPALLLAAFTLTGSATGASSLLAAVTVSAAIGGPAFGALLDRSPRPGRLLAGALVLYATGLAVVLGTLGRVPVAVTLLVAVVSGLLGPALSGGWTAQLPRTVPAGRLPRANALDAMTFGVAGLAGPVLAGGAAEALGAPTAVVVSAVLIAAAAPAAWRLPPVPGPAPAPVSGPTMKSRAAPLTDFATSGVRAIAGSRPLARATLTSVLSCAA
ncbi:MFS transporter, partial [Streptomyces sp. SID4931]